MSASRPTASAPLGSEESSSAFQLANLDFSIVFVDSRPASTVQGADFVGIDNASSIDAIIDFLCRTGDPLIFLGMPRLNSNALEREDAYRARMRELGLEEWLIETDGVCRASRKSRRPQWAEDPLRHGLALSGLSQAIVSATASCMIVIVIRCIESVLMRNEDDAKLLTAAVREATALALDWFNRKPEGWQKADGSGAVSEADLAIDELIRERLTTARPEYAWLSEESDPSPDRLERQRVWVVDPIDGTSTFLSGGDTFTVSAALVEDGTPLLAALAAPALGEFYFAERDAGATLNGATVLPVERHQALEGSVLLGQQALIDQLAPATAGPFSGSIVHRMCMAALGRVDGALTTTPLMEWDVCGAHLFAAELGLTVTDASGAPFTYNKVHPDAPGLICGAESLVTEISKKLQMLVAKL